jgi:2-amino-4-hydroxy-6-hydroxymethyldihydropteridine diphosphokinase
VAHTAFIGIGSNLGDPYRNCTSSIDHIVKDGRTEFVSLSSFYVTSPVSPVAQSDFLNCVLRIGWSGSPHELLVLLKDVETRMGRVRDIPLGPRVIDLDILLFDDMVLDEPHLTIPHPRLHERKFTLVPILELGPAIIHPRLKRPLAQFLDGLGEEQKIRLYEPEASHEIPDSDRTAPPRR